MENSKRAMRWCPAEFSIPKNGMEDLSNRIVVLGNRQKQPTVTEIFSPTVSHPGYRVQLVRAARRGHSILQFDISNAFVQ